MAAAFLADNGSITIRVPGGKIGDIRVSYPKGISQVDLTKLLALATGVRTELAKECRFEVPIAGSKKKGGKSKRSSISAIKLSVFDDGDFVVFNNWAKVTGKKELSLVRLLNSCDKETVMFLLSTCKALMVSPELSFPIEEVKSSLPILTLLGFREDFDLTLVKYTGKCVKRIELAVEFIEEVIRPESIVIEYPMEEVSCKTAAPASDPRDISRSRAISIGEIDFESKEIASSFEGPSVLPSSAPDRLTGEDVDIVIDDFSEYSRPSDSKKKRKQSRKTRRREKAMLGPIGASYDDDLSISAAAGPVHPDDLLPFEFERESRSSYSELLNMEPAVNVGMEPKAIRRLPTQVLCAKDVEVMVRNETPRCGICLTDYSVGDKVLRLPCLHVFHVGCISKWLAHSNKCPQDRTVVDI